MSLSWHVGKCMMHGVKAGPTAGRTRAQVGLIPDYI